MISATSAACHVAWQRQRIWQPTAIKIALVLVVVHASSLFIIIHCYGRRIVTIIKMNKQKYNAKAPIAQIPAYECAPGTVCDEKNMRPHTGTNTCK